MQLCNFLEAVKQGTKKIQELHFRRIEYPSEISGKLYPENYQSILFDPRPPVPIWYAGIILKYDHFTYSDEAEITCEKSSKKVRNDFNRFRESRNVEIEFRVQPIQAPEFTVDHSA